MSWSYHDTYAIIDNDKIINIIVADEYHIANQCARSVATHCFAVNCNLYNCGIGDSYRDGNFYYKDSDTVIPQQLSVEEKINQNEFIRSEQDDLLLQHDYELLMLKEGLTGGDE